MEPEGHNLAGNRAKIDAIPSGEPMPEIKIHLDGDTRQVADICIIGTGAAGCVLAHELTRHGKKVIMLEKGNFYDMKYLQTRSEEELSNLWKNRGIFLSKSFSINIAQGQCVGGSTMINYGICFEIPTPVLEYWNSSFGIKLSFDDCHKAYL